MLPESLTFACPACSTRLTVPSSMAGVIGPCPRCNTRIQAPALPAVAQPATQPQPQAPAPVSPPLAPPVVQVPVTAPAPAEVPVVTAAAGTTPPGYRPEPRQLPHNKVEGKEPIGKRVSDSMRNPGEEFLNYERRSPVLRLVVPVLFLAAAACLVFGILKFVQSRQPVVDAKPLSAPQSPVNADGLSLRKVNDLPPPPNEPDESAPVAPAGHGNTFESLTPPDPSSSLDTPPASAVSPIQVLEKFLAAKTLEERMPLLETATSPADLQASCLAAELRPRARVVPSFRRGNAKEQLTDFYFNVSFTRPQDDKVDNYEMLVRQRGDQAPKIVGDPFLDLYGGRLRKFVSSPVEKPATFQVYAFPNRICTDGKVPNADNKHCMKLCNFISGGEIATVYFSKFSKITKALDEDGDSGKGWGDSFPCTVSLMWNTKDDPAHPYIEVSTVKAWNWNP